jgi:ubiquinone/menaquinone biosynthesis C-methylase UbiE
MNNSDSKDFYNSVSDYYDEMISFNSALEQKQKYLKSFVSNKKKLAADIGCGSGVDSIALSSLGLNVIAFDVSEKMIEKAKTNAKKANTKIEFFNYTADKIPKTFNSKFDFICSLGNTIANITPQNLILTIERFSNLLTKNGKLLFHILNYEKIEKQQERIINIKKGKDDFIIRFYDFNKEFINFNILKFNARNTNEKDLISTKVYPHKLKTLKYLLTKNKFTDIEVYSDLKKTPFSSNLSKDIYLFCERL